MYICQKTGVIVPPNMPKHTLVIEKRKKIYQRPIYRRGNPKNNTRKEMNKREIVDWEEVVGWEIVKEIAVSPAVFEKETGLSAHKVREKAQQPRKLNNEQRQVESERARQRRRAKQKAKVQDRR